ncbi:hypothetical protein SLEP1_g18472 [Rubroshorea leprosula]|uniref:Retrovirus-related Pol polyprotein from transposon RE1 n=1 Tax=Rubroshorea leprosula TaxID=152421 RepID=A0AAV5J3H4_9ROSI|nr:hypothetical protein SLEP1_g18472 [Rubroshorea leprosula]
MVPIASSSPHIGLRLMDIAPSVAPSPTSLSLPSLGTSSSSASELGLSLPSLPLVFNADSIPSVSIVSTTSPNGLDHSTSASQKSPPELIPCKDFAIFDVISTLVAQFFIQALALLHYFLGVEAISTTVNLFLTQHKYIHDLLEHTGMLDTKLVTTPLSSSTQFHLDDDWVGDKDSLISTASDITYLGANPISWRSCKQQVVACSSIEAEYRALAAASCELTWVRHLLFELGVTFSNPPALYCDNIGATYLSSNLDMHSKMKHIAIDIHFVCDLIEKKVLRVSHISSCDQLVDGLTKSIPSSRFLLLRTKIGVSNGSFILWGHKEVNM